MDADNVEPAGKRIPDHMDYMSQYLPVWGPRWFLQGIPPSTERPITGLLAPMGSDEQMTFQELPFDHGASRSASPASGSAGTSSLPLDRINFGQPLDRRANPAIQEGQEDYFEEMFRPSTVAEHNAHEGGSQEIHPLTENIPQPSPVPGDAQEMPAGANLQPLDRPCFLFLTDNEATVRRALGYHLVLLPDDTGLNPMGSPDRHLYYSTPRGYGVPDPANL